MDDLKLLRMNSGTRWGLQSAGFAGMTYCLSNQSSSVSCDSVLSGQRLEWEAVVESRVEGNGQQGNLRDRLPGQSVIAELLHGQAQVPPRGFLRRVFGATPLTELTSAWFKGAAGEIEVARVWPVWVLSM